MMRRLLILVTCLAAPVLAVVVGALPAQAQEQQIDVEKAAEVRANYVLNFVRYTEWPADSFPQHSSPLIVSIVGEDRMSYYLERLAAALPNRTINGRRLEIRYITFPIPLTGHATVTPEQLDEFERQLRESHAVYVAATEWAHAVTIITMLRGANVLSIGDTNRFAENGGMLGLVLRQNSIKFDANIDSIEESSLKVSSKVLRLARIVRKEAS